MALAKKVHHSAQPIPHEDRRMSGPASGARDELYGNDPGPPSLPVAATFRVHLADPAGQG